MRKIYLIQHCQSEHHVNNMTGGWTDTPLTDLGRLQANQIGKRIKELMGTEEFKLYTSDLLRASQTADIVSKHLNLDVTVAKGLREINTGEAAGKTKDWAKKNRNPLPAKGFNIDYQEFNGGETWRQFFIRVSRAMEQITNSDEKNLLLVTHGCTLGYIVAWWMKFDVKMLNRAFFSASPGSISYLLQNKYKQNVLRILNETAHLG